MNDYEFLPQTDDDIPLLAAVAVRKARQHALAHGLSIVEAQGGFLVEVASDGTTRKIKEITPGLRVRRGQTYSM